ELVMEPISRLLEENKNNKPINSCLKYHTFWSVIHGLISIKMTANTPEVADELNKLVLDDAMEGFIKNLKG
ncbi:MAG: TetR/AcrR family transcriptional regulator, partial [Chitinophagaceae bacterium]|nr:TetR/AcrR family transcriptional regulator [Chitinophagaceae bacterium]